MQEKKSELFHECIFITKHGLSALRIHHLTTAVCDTTSFCFPRNIFFQKYLALRRCTGLSWGSEILAGCFALCVSVCLAPSQRVEEGSVVQKSERQHCHWEFACMTVPGSNCEAFFSTAAVSLCCFLGFFFTTALACRCHTDKNKYCGSCTYQWGPFLLFNTSDVNPSVWAIGQWVRATWNRLCWNLVHIQHKHPLLHFLKHRQFAFLYNSVPQLNGSGTPAAHSLKPTYLQFIWLSATKPLKYILQPSSVGADAACRHHWLSEA